MTEVSPIVFYCKDCKKVVENPPRKGKAYIYSCPECHGERVSFGSRNSISDFFQAKLPPA